MPTLAESFSQIGAQPPTRIDHAPTLTPTSNGSANTKSASSGPPRLSSRTQTDEEIIQIAAAWPGFLARMARTTDSTQLHKVQQDYKGAAGFRLIPLMFGQPDIVKDNVKEEFSYPGMPYLLDLRFVEESSGIRVYPNKENTELEIIETRAEWAERTARSLFGPPCETLSRTSVQNLSQELLSYSEERHNQEIELELNASLSYLQALQANATQQNANIDLSVGAVVWHFSESDN